MLPPLPFEYVRFGVLGAPSVPAVRALRFLVAWVPANTVTLGYAVAARAVRIESGTDFPIVVESVRVVSHYLTAFRIAISRR
jgi:hypothetical protein